MLKNLTGADCWSRKALDWLCAGRADYRHFIQRKKSPAHRNRARYCKSLWIGAGLIMILNPSINLLVTLLLLSTFLSFALLDEPTGS